MSDSTGTQPANPSSPEAREQGGFDARLARLEEIVRDLEDGGLELEPAIARYKEGVGLLSGCRELLAGYRKQVEELSEAADGAVRPYAGDPDVAGER